MLYGISNLSIVPIRFEPSNQSEMTSQLLFGEHFIILEKQKKWSKIKICFDDFEGFVDNSQYEEISETYFEKLKLSETTYCGEIIDFISDSKKNLLTIPLGACLPFYNQQHFSINDEIYHFEGQFFSKKLSKNHIIQKAYLYLNTPFLWGGKTPFGIDSDGFTQMVYKLCGHSIPRKVTAQLTQGNVLSFIEESEPGDLAFFDDEDGEIVHVGIMLNNYQIMHVDGKVRIDTLDHSGIFNTDLQQHTHQLRVIKKLL